MSRAIKVTVTHDGKVGEITGEWGDDIGACLDTVANAIVKSKITGYTLTITEDIAGAELKAYHFWVEGYKWIWVIHYSSAEASKRVMAVYPGLSSSKWMGDPTCVRKLSKANHYAGQIMMDDSSLWGPNSCYDAL